MSRWLRLPESADDGFTLIELLIVILILGVLAGVAVFAVGGFTNAGKDEACSTEYKTLTTALEAFKIGAKTGPSTSLTPNRNYPADLNTLKTAKILTVNVKNSVSTDKWTYTPDTTSQVSNQITAYAGGDTAIIFSPAVNAYGKYTLAPVSGSGCVTPT